jgi:hypothetical protein
VAVAEGVAYLSVYVGEIEKRRIDEMNACVMMNEM